MSKWLDWINRFVVRRSGVFRSDLPIEHMLCITFADAKELRAFELRLIQIYHGHISLFEVIKILPREERTQHVSGAAHETHAFLYARGMLISS